MTDADPWVRAEAITTLARLPLTVGTAQTYLSRIADHLGDPHAEPRCAAAAALGDFARAGAKVGPEIRARLRALLDPGDTLWAFESALTLAALGDSAARPHLEANLGGGRRRLDAVEALAQLGDAAAVPALNTLRRRWWLPWVDRLAAAASAASLGEAGATQAVRSALRSRRLDVRIYGAALAGQRRLSALRPDLQILADRPGEQAREAALEALFALGESEPTGGWSDTNEDPALSTRTPGASSSER